ncbi:MAG: 30S ribosomal protein S8 [Patescibacteria group bacterium]|nr:30S ribosomal protein S8 [Patescibacteria group bacterium]
MDPISNMLTQIRNSFLVGQPSCLVRYSKIKEEVLKILKEGGYIRDYKIEEKNSKKNIRVLLSYDKENKSVIHSLKRISKPGRRIYKTAEKLNYVLGGMGMLVLSTSRGMMSDRSARKEGVGGEVICEVW